MKTCNYVINRDDIYIGIVSDIIDKSLIEYYEDGIYDVSLSTPEDIARQFECRMHTLYGHLWDGGFIEDDNWERKIFFVLDENNLADDLLYDSPKYPVFNLSDDNICIKADISIRRHAYKIGKVLEYLGFPEKLSFEDVLRMKKLFTNDWVLDNCTLFGIHETGEHETSRETYDSHGKHRTFNLDLKDGVFPKCYFNAFWFTRAPYEPRSEEGLITSLEEQFNNQNGNILPEGTSMQLKQKRVIY